MRVLTKSIQCYKHYTRHYKSLQVQQYYVPSSCVPHIDHLGTNKHNYSSLSCINNHTRVPVKLFDVNVKLRRCNSTSYSSNGWFKWLSESAPVEQAQEFLLAVHSSTGLPWWGSIVLTTVILRATITLPLGLYQNYILAKVENLYLEMPAIVQELKRETAYAIDKFKWTEQQARIMYNHSLRKQWNNLIMRDNCHPLKSTVLLWIQLPMWIFLSMGLRNLIYMMPKFDLDAQITFAELTVGGCAWFPNLTECDASYILPVTLGLVNLAIVEIQAMSRVRTPSKLNTTLTNFFRVLSVAMIPLAANVPVALALYWTTSSVFGLGQNLLLMSPKVKRICKIPKTKTEMTNPYLHLYERLHQRFIDLQKKFTKKTVF